MSNLTKRALLAAFGSLLEEKPFNKITITDLTRRCGTNRMTFYYHFHNIYELIIWGFETQLHEICRDHITYGSWKTGYLRVFDFALERKSYIRKIFQTIAAENLEHYLNRIAEGMVLSVIDEGGTATLGEDDRQFTARIVAHVLVGILVDWIDRGMKEPPALMVKRAARLLDGIIEKTAADSE